jgi:uncharacterized protein YbjT (DUF2867 family)
MKIVVVGGSGRIGAKLVTILTRDGHKVVAASRRSGVDAVSGAGLTDALRDASVVVDVLNSPSFEDTAVMKFFTASTQNLLACEAAAGVGHHVMLSVVGTERLLQSGYLRAKFAQEQLIRDSSVPYSIVQTTQFFEFLSGIADAATHGTAVRVPPVLIQPIAADDVARAVAKIATGTPLNGTVEIGGPEPFYLDELIRRNLGARNDLRDVIVDPHARYFGAEINKRSLIAGDEAELGNIRFDDWLAQRAHSMTDANVQPAVVTSAARAQLKESSQFDVWTGLVVRGPATQPLKTYRVTVDGEVGRVDVPLAHAVQGE